MLLETSFEEAVRLMREFLLQGVILVGTVPLGGLLITSRIIEHDVAGSFECLCFQEFEDDSFGDALK